ncbi:MAG TPA: hypothetical protein VK887_11285 [Pseudonocardiaceae bacterium]|nr:hypothetical protein [Pseudonocardiaceae bacterium]
MGFVTGGWAGHGVPVPKTSWRPKKPELIIEVDVVPCSFGFRR